MPSRAEADVRYSFTGQFLRASTIFVRKARDIEALPPETVRGEMISEHRGLVCSAIMQCVAALESEADEICTHGPGAHLG